MSNLTHAGPQGSLGFTLSQLGLATSRAFAALVGSIGLEPRQFAVLRAATVWAGVPQQALADRLGIPASTMVGIVDGLETQGLVARERSVVDRRAQTLRLTPAGEARLASGVELAVRRERELCEGLREDEREALLSLLGRVAANLGLAPGILPDGGAGLDDRG